MDHVDILRPPLVWIDGRCYRKNIVDNTFRKRLIGDGDTAESEPYFSISTGQDNDVVCDSKYQIYRTPGGIFKTSVYVPPSLIGHIIGTKGATKKRIETETQAKILVPRQGTKGNVEITGPKKCGVASCRSRIELLMQSTRAREPFTHFISVPLTKPAMKESFLEFKSQVLDTCMEDRGLEESIFQNVDKLHLTIGTLLILSDEEKAQAIRIFESCRDVITSSILKNAGLQVTVEGLEYMNDDPAEVDVLYAKVQTVGEATALQRIADYIVEQFRDSGLIQQQHERDKVKLHATLMNTVFRAEKMNIPDVGHKKKRETFDSRNILHVFGKHRFAQFYIPEIHLSQRYTEGKDGFYLSTARLPLN